MGARINPALLQLIGLGTAQDAYLPDGRHLRWFMHRELGFPRSGFRLRRRPGLAPWNEKRARATGILREQHFYEGAVQPVGQTGTGGVRLANGLVIENFQALQQQAAPPWPGLYPRLTDQPLTLGFGPKPPIPTGADAYDPAAYVFLVFLRREDTGWTWAKATSSAGGQTRTVDQGAVGRRLRLHLPGLLRRATTELAGAVRLLSTGDRLASAAELVARNAALHRALLTRARTPATGRTPDLRIADPRVPDLRIPDLRIPDIRIPDIRIPDIRVPTARYVIDSVLLHGGLIDRVTLTGHDAVLASVQWLSTREYAGIDGWEDIDTFHLPVTHHGPYYPEWTADSGHSVARSRLKHAHPHARAPWDEAAHPPPTNPAGVRQDQRKRYLDDAFVPLRRALRRVLKRELTELRPQFQVETEVEAQPLDQPGVDSATLTERLFDTIYAAAADPAMARLLGLMHTDLPSAQEATLPRPMSWDYVVDANFPALWLRRLLLPGAFDMALDKSRAQLLARFRDANGELTDEGLGHLTEMLGNTEACMSMATALTASAVALPRPPLDLEVDISAEPSAGRLKTEVKLSWQLRRANFFEDPRGADIFYALRRSGPDGDRVLNRRDPDNHLFAPLVPTVEAEQGDEAGWIDRQLRLFGSYAWKLSAMDLFGRWSPPATAQGEVRDLLPPLPPAVVSASLDGQPDDAPDWPTVTLVFDWTTSQADDAPDLDHFIVHLAHGEVPVLDAELPATWQGLELSAGQHAPALIVPWPVPGGPLPNRPDVTASAEMSPLSAELGGGHRITVRLGGVRAPYDDAGFARISATAMAMDQAGNRSGPGRRVVGVQVDPSVPPPPPLLPGPQWTSRPDARARAFYRLPLQVPVRTRVQVLRASQASLLAAGQTSDAAWEAMDPGQKVAHLKQLAIAHKSAFKPDHPLPLDHTATEHRVELNGNERGMTVITVARIGRTGTRTDWPQQTDFFAVLAVPRMVKPPKPLVDEARASDRATSLRIQPDPTGRTVALRVYRTRHPDRLDDIRRMRPIGVLAVPVVADDDQPDAIVSIDQTVSEWRTYAYRVVAVGEEGVRSEPTDPIFLRPWSTQPPAAPTLTEVSRLPANTHNAVFFEAPRSDYAFELLRRPANGLRWGAPVPIDPATLSVQPVPGGARLTYEDALPAGQLGLRFAYRIRVRDPGGQTADSALRMEVP